jgi:hypothetical protein
MRTTVCFDALACFATLNAPINRFIDQTSGTLYGPEGCAQCGMASAQSEHFARSPDRAAQRIYADWSVVASPSARPLRVARPAELHRQREGAHMSGQFNASSIRSNRYRRPRSRAATTAAVISLGAFGSAANAALFTFDPDGPAPANAPTAVQGLDWGVGNSLSVGRVPPVVGGTFQQYYQATLAGVINGGGNTIQPTGLNSTFEITVVASLSQAIDTVSTGAGVTSVHTHIAPVQAANSFFEIWYDNTPDASNLAGTGFNDGTRIFIGSPNPARPASSIYANAATANGAPIVENFDDFGADNYPNIMSLTGSGGMNFETTVGTADANFFLTALQSMLFNSSMNTPFRETDPSALFAGLANGTPPAIVPNLGAINGATGPDFQFQADANSTFTPIPEPIGAAASLLCLSGLILRRRAGR